MPYAAAPKSLADHETPGWWRDAKLGIMMHWSLSSVPAWAPPGNILDLLRDRPQDALAHTPYAEWYENSLKFPNGPTATWHRERWGERAYASFQAEFERGLADWSPEPLLDLVEASGARYFVPITKHHDGYCLWPTATPNPMRGGEWRSSRDIVGELAAGIRRAGLGFGVYYSGGLDWTLDPRPVANLADMRMTGLLGPAATALVRAHYDELIARYDPDILWNDIGYPDADDLWSLLAGYYSGRPDRLINDRFQLPDPASARLDDPEARAALNARIAGALAEPGFAFAPERPPVFDHRTPEYAVIGAANDGSAWETVRGVGHSFGYNRAETADDHLSADALVTLFASVVGDGGNLLINVGPRADGSIPREQSEPLRALGAWVSKHGEAIYGTRRSSRFQAWREGATAALPVETAGKQFVILVGRPLTGELRLNIGPGVLGFETLLGERLETRTEGADIVVAVPYGKEPAIALRVLC